MAADRTAAGAILSGIYGPFADKSKEEIAEAFQPVSKNHTLTDWTGTYVDIFSPDYKSIERQPWDMNEASRRFIDLSGGELRMSADFGDGANFGRRFDPTTSASPVFVQTSEAQRRQVNFLPTVPPDADVYADAVNGALVFNVTLGRAFGCSCLKWSAPHRGSGGKFGDQLVPPNDADNFFVRVTDASTVPTDTLYHEIPEHYDQASSQIGWSYGAGFSQLAHGTMTPKPPPPTAK